MRGVHQYDTLRARRSADRLSWGTRGGGGRIGEEVRRGQTGLGTGMGTGQAGQASMVRCLLERGLGLGLGLG